MYCQNCGNMVADDCRVCPTCGRPPLRSAHSAAAPGLADDAGMRLLMPIGRSVYAIAAGYLGLLSPLVLPAPFAVLCGFLAIRDMRLHPEKHGMGRAIFGIVMGGLVMLILSVALVLSVLHG